MNEIDLTGGDDSDNSTVAYEISSTSSSDSSFDDFLPSSSKRAKIDSSKEEEKHGKQSTIDESIGSMRLTRVAKLSNNHNQNAVSIKQILAGQPGFGPLLRSFQFNYLFDIEWLLEQYPSYARTLPLFIVHGLRDGNLHGLKLQKEPYPQINLLKAHLESMYGTHHTKMMLLEFRNGLQIVIHTSNLIEQDWHQKTQMVWSSPLLRRKGDSSTATKSSSFFLQSIAQYLRYYKINELSDFCKEMEQKFDFSVINDERVHFIGSVPGRHKGMLLNSFGHMRLRTLLKKKLTKYQNCSKFKPLRPIYQFSSIGSLGSDQDKWLQSEFTESCTVFAHERLSNVGHLISTSATSLASKPRPLLIFPCVNDVKESLEGYAAGGSLPYQRQTAEKQPWLRNFLHCWRSHRSGRSRAMPHVKTYSVLSNDFSKIFYFLLTSANLSKAAWGRLEKNESQLMILSYEAGVLMLPPLLDQEDQLPFWQVEQSPLPFDVPPQPYSQRDQPWVVDDVYRQPDSHGNTWPC